MSVEPNYLVGVELVQFPFATKLSASRVRTTMFAWCGFAREARLIAAKMQTEAIMKHSQSDVCESPMYLRSVAYGMMAYEALDRLTLASTLADRLDQIECAELERAVVM